MQNRAKKWFMSLVVRTMVAITIFAVVFLVNRISPELLEPMRKIRGKNIDIQKIITLLKEIIEETF